MKLLAVNFLFVLGLLSTSFSKGSLPVQENIVFRNATVENLYPKEVIFRVEICGRPSGSLVIFNYMEYRLGTWSKEPRTMDDGQTPDGCYKLKYFLETRNLYIPPFFRIKYFWSITEGTKVIGQSFSYAYTYKNEAYSWKNLEDEHFIIWWHDRPDSFGKDVMSVATLALNDQAKFYSSSLDDSIIIVITNTPDEFFAWQPEKKDMSGIAFPKMSLTIELIEENSYYRDQLNDIIPHEISHIYFHHLAKDESGIPHWLNEGLATYNEYSDHWGNWMTLKTAYETSKTVPLKSLEGDFGTDREKIELAYAESYYAVLYMDEVYGKDSISTLLNEYSKGIDTATAFEKAFSKDPANFDNDFIAWLGGRLKTAPPDTRRSLFTSNDTQIGVYFLVSLCCLGMLFAMAGGVIFIAILLANKRTRRIIEANVQSDAHSTKIALPPSEPSP